MLLPTHLCLMLEAAPWSDTWMPSCTLVPLWHGTLLQANSIPSQGPSQDSKCCPDVLPRRKTGNKEVQWRSMALLLRCLNRNVDGRAAAPDGVAESQTQSCFGWKRYLRSSPTICTTCHLVLVPYCLVCTYPSPLCSGSRPNSRLWKDAQDLMSHLR